MGDKDSKDNNVEESEDEGTRENREEQNVGILAKGTRSHSARGVGEQQGRK